MPLSLSSLNSSPHFKNRSTLFYFLFLILFPSLILLFIPNRGSLLPPLPFPLSLFPSQSPPISISVSESAQEPPISPSELPSISNAFKSPTSASLISVSEPPSISIAFKSPTSTSPISVSEPPSISNAPEEPIPPIEPVVGPDPVGGEIGDGGESRREKKCNLYEGRWEKDEEEGRHPLYAPGSCPFVDDAFTCQENGRPDRGYMKWRWKPKDCELPRFNATDLLERLRGKRLMLVGDSMNRNQFESILCLLREPLPDKSKMYETRGHKVSKGRGYFNFVIEDYNCTVEFIQSHFLARQGTRVNGQGGRNPILEIDRVDRSANRWKKADILVFNTGHWWAHGKTARGKNYYKENGVVYPQFDAAEAFKRAMRTWGKWIDENIDHRKSLVFYRGYSSAHFRGGDWDSGGTCNGETEPALSGAIIDSYPSKMKIMEEVIAGMKSPVVLLNVTKLTNFRKDGHPSIYGTSVSPGQKVSRRKQDCSHWCLPGVPDAWNELIYATLVLDQYRT